jgi:hypothetical protein
MWILPSLNELEGVGEFGQIACGSFRVGEERSAADFMLV